MKTKIPSIYPILSIWFILCITCLSSCDRDEILDESQPPRSGEVRPLGEPLGEAEVFTVDKSGGTITSSDGSITLEFPAGAVSATTTVTIQKLVNTTPNGIGDAFRLSPHADFASPVTILMKYSLDSVSVVDGLGMAYQDETGVWNAVQVLEHDKQAQTVSVQTTHFSDWSLFESVRITPSFSVVAPDEQVNLHATAVLKGEELLTPLTEVSTPLGSTPLDPAYIGMWNLEGPGTLVPDGNNARYKAVADYGNTVHVTLTLNIPGAPPNVAKAKIIIGGSYVTFAGGPGGTVTVHGYAAAVYAAQIDATVIQFKGLLNGEEYNVVIHYPAGGAGTIPWVVTTEIECHVQSGYTYGGGSVTGAAGNPDSEKGLHDGSITIDSYQPVGRYISGTFQGGQTYYPENCFNCRTKGSISGTFFAKRYL